MKIYIKTGIILSIIFTWACTNDFEEINQNPNGPTKVPAALLIPAQLERTQDELYSTFTGGDMGNCWAQLWSKVQYNDEARYNPRGSIINRIWNNFYAGSLMDGKVMLEIATEEGNENLQGVAKVLMTYNFSILTDMYGDIPFTDARC